MSHAQILDFTFQFQSSVWLRFFLRKNPTDFQDTVDSPEWLQSDKKLDMACDLLFTNSLSPAVWMCFRSLVLGNNRLNPAPLVILNLSELMMPFLFQTQSHAEYFSEANLLKLYLHKASNWNNSSFSGKNCINWSQDTEDKLKGLKTSRQTHPNPETSCKAPKSLLTFPAVSHQKGLKEENKGWVNVSGRTRVAQKPTATDVGPRGGWQERRLASYTDSTARRCRSRS